MNHHRYLYPLSAPLLIVSFLVLWSTSSTAQQRLKVLFLGNSYTHYNNLPQLVHNIALSMGDTLVFDSYAPGGATLLDHSTSSISQQKIRQGDWDYVVLQGQSQEPITNRHRFNQGFNGLYHQIKQYNPCAIVMPYMTWGRKNGDASRCASFPVMCTYEGMDSTLRNRYLDRVAYANGAIAPVSVVWKQLRQQHPSIDLYHPDQSHPSPAGSYAAACCFYTALFKRDPTLVSYNYTLSSSDAAAIKTAAKTVVYDDFSPWNFKQLPHVDLTFLIGSGMNEVHFTAVNRFNVRQDYFWDFGDSTTSTATSPSHSYAQDGSYRVRLTLSNCYLDSTYTQQIDTIIHFCSHTPTVVTTNPWLCQNDTLWTQSADAYQWLHYGRPIPETQQYLHNYTRYGISNFSVQTTQQGCTELSTTYQQSPQWSNYYFDIRGGDPCMGDTVSFAVLHTMRALSGVETILWFRNNTLLAPFTNRDTLWISNQGIYKCQVIDPTSNCPYDTTSYSIEYVCPLGLDPVLEASPASWTLFPNPATNTLTLQIEGMALPDSCRIYNAMGLLVYEARLTTSMTLNIAALPSGIYVLHLPHGRWPSKLFVKQ